MDKKVQLCCDKYRVNNTSYSHLVEIHPNNFCLTNTMNLELKVVRNSLLCENYPAFPRN